MYCQYFQFGPKSAFGGVIKRINENKQSYTHAHSGTSAVAIIHEYCFHLADRNVIFKFIAYILFSQN